MKFLFINTSQIRIVDEVIVGIRPEGLYDKKYI